MAKVKVLPQSHREKERQTGKELDAIRGRAIT